MKFVRRYHRFWALAAVVSAVEVAVAPPTPLCEWEWKCGVRELKCESWGLCCRQLRGREAGERRLYEWCVDGGA